MRRVKKISWTVKLKIAMWILILSGGIYFFFTPCGKALVDGIQNAYQTITQKSHLILGQVTVEGHLRTPLAVINHKLNLSQGMSMFDINIEAKRKELMKLPWIKSVTIERHLPSTLYVRIVEREPIAVWQNNQKYFPLDAEGNVIEDSQTKLSNLILIVGEGAPSKLPTLIKALEEYPDIREKLRSAVWTGKRRWNLYLNDVEDGLEINLPETDLKLAFARLIAANNKEKILKKDLKVIDLRIPDRLIVQKRGKKK